MAATLATVRDEVRRHMNDLEPGKFAVSTLVLNRIIEGLARDVDSELDSGQTWVVGAITLNPATTPPDYPLPAAAVEYQNMLDLRRASDGFILVRRSQEYISRVRWNSANATAQFVSEYALVQSLSGSSEIVTVMFDVRPSATGTVDLLAARSLVAFNHDDTTVIPFARDFMEGFEQGAAARAIDMMKPADRDERGFSGLMVRGQYQPSPHVMRLEAAYQKALKKERLRLIRLELSENPTELERSSAWWW